jgi:hypothetical protein
VKKSSPKSREFYVSNVDLNKTYIEWYKEIINAESLGKEEPQIPAEIVDAIMKISTKLSYKPSFINYSYREDMVMDAQLECIRNVKKFDPSKIIRKLWLSSSPFKKGDTITGETSQVSGKLKFNNPKTGLVSLNMPLDKSFLVGEVVKCNDMTAVVVEIKDHLADNPFAFITTIAFNCFLIRIDKEKQQSYIKGCIIDSVPLDQMIELQEHDIEDGFDGHIEFIRDNSEYMSNNMPQSMKRKERAILLHDEEETEQ